MNVVYKLIRERAKIVENENIVAGFAFDFSSIF